MPGAYPIVPSAAVGTGLSDYTITYVNGTLTITKALLKAEEGDVVKMRTPTGIEEIEIVSVRYA